MTGCGQRVAPLPAFAEVLARMGSWELDLITGTTSWSEGMYRLLGRRPTGERRTEAQVLEFVHPDDRARMRRVLADVTERPQEVPEPGHVLEFRMVRADGLVCELRALGRVERDETGWPARWIGVVQDVTQQRSSERELRAHYAVSQALREWESFELGVVDLLRRIATALDHPMASLWLWDASVEALTCRAFWCAPHVDPGGFEEVTRGAGIRAGEGALGLAWQTREPVVTADVATDPAFVLREAALARGITSAVAFPAVGPDGPVAVLCFYAFERRVPSAELLRTLTAIGRELGRFLSRRRPELSPRPLSARELEVLRLAAEGLSGAGIAEELVVGHSTVKTHLEHIYDKLGVGNRAAAVAHALRRGLID